MNNKLLHSDEYGTITYREVPVQDGDVVVVKAGTPTEAIDQLSDMLGETGRPRSIIVAVSKMSDLKALDQDIMANYGWFRDNRLMLTKKFLEARIKEERAIEDGLEGLYQGVYYTLTGKYYNHE